MDTSTDPDSLPFALSPDQVSLLNNLSADEWVQHCKNIRANHPRTDVVINRFLSLLLEDIVRIFRAEVRQLASASPSSTSTIIPSSSNTPTLVAMPSGPIQMSAEDIPKLSPAQICSLAPVTPKSIPMDLYLKLSPEQMDAMPLFITPITGEELSLHPIKNLER